MFPSVLKVSTFLVSCRLQLIQDPTTCLERIFTLRFIFPPLHPSSTHNKEFCPLPNAHYMPKQMICNIPAVLLGTWMSHSPSLRKEEQHITVRPGVWTRWRHTRRLRRLSRGRTLRGFCRTMLDPLGGWVSEMFRTCKKVCRYLKKKWDGRVKIHFKLNTEMFILLSPCMKVLMFTVQYYWTY